MFYLILNYCFRTKIGRKRFSGNHHLLKRRSTYIRFLYLGLPRAPQNRSVTLSDFYIIMIKMKFFKSIFLYLCVVSLDLSIVSLTSVCKTATKIVILCLQVIMIMSQHFSKAEVLTSISHPQNGLKFLTVTLSFLVLCPLSGQIIKI